MRCVDVIRELAAPTGGPEPAGLAEHLADCPRCAAWAARNARLDRLWEATRPPLPSPATWDAVWARVAAAPVEPASKPSRLAALSSSPLPWRPAALVAFGLAQAAAILIAALVLWRTGQRPSPLPTPSPMVASQTAPTPPPRVAYEIDQGPPVIFTTDGRDIRVRQLALNEEGTSTTVDPYYAMFNAVEAMAPAQ